MRKRIILLKILFFLGWISSTSVLFCQSRDEVYNFAQSEYSNGHYANAIKEFERCLFNDVKVNSEILRKLADSYRSMEEFEKASEYYEKAFHLESSDSFRTIDLFSKVECQISVKNYSLALVDLLSFDGSVSKMTSKKIQFLSGICYFGMNDFDNSEKCLLESIDSSFNFENRQIDAIFKDKKLLERPDPHMAYILSLFLPGLGQFYSGDIRNGVNSLLLTSFIAFLGIRIALNQTLLDAGIILLPWFQRYYQGGIMRAESIAIERRKENQSYAFSEIMRIIASTKQ